MFNQKFLIKLRILAVILAIMTVLPTAVFALPPNPTQAELETELNDIERQITEYSIELSKTKTQKNTLNNKIKQLQIKQSAIGLQIKQSALKISNLDKKIITIQNNIQKNLLKENSLNNDVGAILRQLNHTEENILIALLSSAGLSGIFNEIENYQILTGALRELADQTRAIRTAMAAEQIKMEEQKDETANLLQIKSIQQRDLNGNLTEQKVLLTETKGLESNYQTILNDSKKRAAEIRNRIYELFNTGKQITFGQATEIAKWASGITGIRPAFLLAILTQESNLGKNVGTCNRLGDPPEKSWKVIMKPERDQEPFKTITAELGLDIDSTPVSCPMRDKKGNQIGWGGAMGPAQFIPSTWMGYRTKVMALTGKSTANPWDIRDAFLAAAVKLKNDGADGTDDGEWKAAMKYFAGSVNLKYRFYGDNVLKITKQYIIDIDELK